MLRAIETKYLPATNALNSRAKATARKRSGDAPEISVMNNWDAGASVEENHARVAKLLAAKMKWAGLYVGGGLPDDSGFVFVNIGKCPLARRWPNEFGMCDRDWFIMEISE